MVKHEKSATPAGESSPMEYTLLRKQKRIDLAEAAPLEKPLSLYIEPTNICNFKCIYCPESFADYEEKSGGLFRLSADDFSRISEQVSEMGGVETLNFYMMGEPLANKHLTDFIKIAKEKSLAKKSS